MSIQIDTKINIQDEVIDLYHQTKEKYSFVRLEEMIAYAVGLGIQQIAKETAGEKLYTKEEALEQIMFRREAEDYLGVTPQNFQYHMKAGNIKPAKEYGEGKAKSQLFWKDELKKRS